MSEGSWHALILAAGRGPGDPMARAYGVTHKCLVPIGGVPMLLRVVETLTLAGAIDGIRISIDDVGIAREALGDLAARCDVVASRESAARSAIAALGPTRDGEGSKLSRALDHVRNPACGCRASG